MKSFASIPALLPLISFIIGIVLYDLYPKINTVTIVCYTICVFITLFISLSTKFYYKNIITIRTVLILMVFNSLGYYWSKNFDVHNDKHYIGNLIEDANKIVVTVTETPIPKTITILVPAKIIGIQTHNNKSKNSFGKVNLYFYTTDSMPQLTAGDTIVLPNKLVKMVHSNNPFSFNYAQYAKYQQLNFQGFYSINDIIYYNNQTASNDKSFINNLRQKALNNLKDNINDNTTLAISMAMLFNERTLLHDDIYATYAKTGIIHIISISGMHIELCLMGIMLFLSWMKNNKYKWVKYIIATILIWLYISMTLYPPSAVRAGIMFTITAISILINRKESRINSLAFTALLMLFINPYWLYNLGFQLSFLCMLSIYLFYQPIKKLFYSKYKIIRYLWNGIAMSIAVQILVAPLVIYYFHQFPLFVFIVNIPAAIFSTILMLGNFFIIILGSLFSMHWLGDLLSTITNEFNKIVAFFSSITPQNLTQYAFDKIDVVLATTLTASLASYLFYIRNKMMLYTTISILCVFVFNIIGNHISLSAHQRIVVYQSNRNALIQLIQGNKQYIYTTDSTNMQRFIQPPMLHWKLNQSYEQLPPLAKFKIDNYTIAILDTTSYVAEKIDIIILTNNVNFNLTHIYQTIQPKLIVLDSSYPRWKAQKLISENNHFPIPIYSVTLSGAFIFPSL